MLALVLLAASLVSADESGRAVPADLLQKAWTKGTVRVIVELGGVGALPEGHLLSHAAVTAQRGRIASDRSALRFALRGLRHRVLREFKTIAYVGLEVDYDTLRVLDALPGLATRVHEDILLRPMLAESGPLIKAPEAWAGGWDGTGQVIAIIDTGVDKTHPFLADKVIEEACYDSSGVSTCPNGLTSDTSSGAGTPCTFAPDDCRHGTHVAGIAAGSGTSFDGVAPGASLLAVRVFHLEPDAGDCAPDPFPCALASFMDIVEGLERVYELRDTHDIAAANLSLGGSSFAGLCDGLMPAMDAAIANLRSAGIATVVASGNDGLLSATSFPACISTAISVGATGDGSGGWPSDQVTWFSNSASFLSLLAPGALINSSVPGGGFSNAAGTSMAAPHVAGAWAVMKQQNPGASVQSVLDGLKNTGKPIKDPGNGITKSRIAFTLLQFSANAYSVTESAGSVPITVTRTGATFGTVTVHYATSPGSAVAGQDYTQKSGTLTFGGNETSKTFSVSVVNTTQVDGPRTVNLTLTNPGGGALLGPQDTATLTINDNDVGGSIQFSASQYSVNEGQGMATITVARSNGSASNVTVHYTTTAGSATPGADYTESSGTVTFGTSQMSNTFKIPIVNDKLAEGPETVLLQLSSRTGSALLGPRQTAVLTILDDDAGGAFRFGASTYSASESTAAVNVTVTRSNGTAGNGTVRVVSVPGGTAVPGVDYTLVDQVLAFAAAQGSRTVPITLLTSANTAADGPRTIKLALKEPGPAGLSSLGSPATTTVTIGDNDVAGTLQFSPAALSVLENVPAALLTVTRTAGAASGVGVAWEITGGTAVHGTDYTGGMSGTLTFGSAIMSQTISIPLLNPAGAHGSRTIQVTLKNPTPGRAKLGSAKTATVTVLDDVVGFRFNQGSYSAIEGAGATITVQRTGPTVPAVSISYETGPAGTAIPGTHYSPVNSTFSFAAGQTSKSFTVPLKNNFVTEPGLTVQLRLKDPAGGELVSPSDVLLTLNDNDAPGVFRFSSGTYAATEGTTATLTVARTGGSGGGITVPWSITGGAATHAIGAGPGVDVVTPDSGVLTFGPNQTSATFQISVQPDDDVESDETVQIALGAPSPSGTIGNPGTATLVVVDTDRAGTFQFTAAAVSLTEAAGAVSLNVTRTGNTTGEVHVDWAISGGSATRGDAAASGVDYVAPAGGTLTFADGQTTRTIDLTILGDTDLEGNETIVVGLQNPEPGWALGTVAASTVVLLEGTVQFAGLPFTVSEGSGSKTITVTRSGLTALPVTVSYAAGPGGPATPAAAASACSPGADYRPVAGTMTFSPGQTSKTFSVPLCGDTLVDGNETLTLTLAVVSGPVIIGNPGPTATLTITENDLAGAIRFSSATYTAGEGQGNATLTVSRTGSGGGVAVHWAIDVDGSTAVHGVDYTGPLEGDIEFGSQTSKSLVIPLVNTPAADGPRTIKVELSGPLPLGLASLGSPVQAILTINDNEPALRLNSAAYVIGEASASFNVTVLRSGPTAAALSVDLVPQTTSSATGGTCGAGGADFAASVIHVEIASGQGSKMVPVPICSDPQAEGTETFGLALQNPVGATLGSPATATVSLTDNELGGTIRWSVAAASGVEGTTLLLTVTRTGGTASDVTVQVTAHDGDADTPGADAQAGVDYEALPPTTLTFDSGIPSQTVEIPLMSRDGVQAPRAFRVTLHDVEGGAALGSPSTVTVWILDPS